MRDSKDIVSMVVNGKGPELAKILEVSTSRCYEILSTDNPIPKSKRLIRAIAQVNPLGIALIRADFDAMFDELAVSGSISTPQLTRDLFEAGQSVLEGKPIGEQRTVLLKAIADAECKLKEIDVPCTARETGKAIVENHKQNGSK